MTGTLLCAKYEQVNTSHVIRIGGNSSEWGTVITTPVAHVVQWKDKTGHVLLCQSCSPTPTPPLAFPDQPIMNVTCPTCDSNSWNCSFVSGRRKATMTRFSSPFVTVWLWVGSSTWKIFFISSLLLEIFWDRIRSMSRKVSIGLTIAVAVDETEIPMSLLRPIRNTDYRAQLSLSFSSIYSFNGSTKKI